MKTEMTNATVESVRPTVTLWVPCYRFDKDSEWFVSIAYDTLDRAEASLRTTPHVEARIARIDLPNPLLTK